MSRIIPTPLLNFLDLQDFAVVSTLHKDKPTPESALIAFWHSPQLELFFQTHRDGRKAENLRSNPHVSFVFGLDEECGRTLQYEGVAAQLTAPNEIESCKQGFIVRNSPTASPAFLDRPEAVFFKVVPTWVGYTDYSGEKPKVTELHFNDKRPGVGIDLAPGREVVRDGLEPPTLRASTASSTN